MSLPRWLLYGTRPSRLQSIGLVLNHLLPWSYIFLDVDVLLDRRKNRKLLLITVFDFH